MNNGIITPIILKANATNKNIRIKTNETAKAIGTNKKLSAIWLTDHI